ncbi:hypothetical protein Leryth_005208 [Lithospermum erythrorhizon]|nr:hypothetical protein Leryth_005208 [Lithospermum erythrorhizon]
MTSLCLYSSCCQYLGVIFLTNVGGHTSKSLLRFTELSQGLCTTSQIFKLFDGWQLFTWFCSTRLRKSPLNFKCILVKPDCELGKSVLISEISTIVRLKFLAMDCTC